MIAATIVHSDAIQFNDLAFPEVAALMKTHQPEPPMQHPTPGLGFPSQGLFLDPLLAPHSEPAWVATFNANHRRVASLRPGWDGPGSIRISPRALYTASRITRRALGLIGEAVAPYIVPGGDGSVQLEWHERHGELELDIDCNGHVSIWGRDHRTCAEFEADGEEAIALFYRWAPWTAAGSTNVSDVPVAPAPRSFQFAA
jgi:hypothetical protein